MKRQTLIRHITKAIRTTASNKEGQLYFIQDVESAMWKLKAEIRAEIESEKPAENLPVAQIRPPDSNATKSVLNEAGCFPFSVGLNPITVRGLQQIAQWHKLNKKGWPKEVLAALYAIKFALANPDQFSKWIDGLCRYREWEGISSEDHALQLIEGHKAYRKKPLPTNWLPFER